MFSIPNTNHSVDVVPELKENARALFVI